MGGLYDRVNKQLNDDKSEGITALDIADLPEKQRKVMFSLLRDRTAATKGVSLEYLHEKTKNPVEELAQVLDELIRDGWLIVSGEGETRQYRVNLRRKPGASLSMGIFSMVVDRLANKPPDSSKP